jgi:hypothetical protein
MATYNGWTIVTMPDSPAPKAAEFSRQNVVAASTNPFTGQQQIVDWQAAWLECTVTLPPMRATTAADWIDFLIACKGTACVFAISNTTFLAMVPSAANPVGYWRLKSNQAKWSITEAVLYGINFDMREAL